MTRKHGQSLLEQISTLMWKNRILKQRHYIATTFEIIIPALMVLLFAAFKTLQPNTDVPAGYVLGSTSMNLFTPMGNRLGSVMGTSLGKSVPAFVFTETSMTGLLLGLGYQAMDDFYSNKSTTLTGTNLLACETKVRFHGYTSMDPNSSFAFPTECQGQVVPYKIAIAPRNKFTVDYFGGTMSAWYPMIPLANQSSGKFNATPVVPSWRDSVMYFDTADALESYVAGPMHGKDTANPKIYAGIVFDTYPTDDQIGTSTAFEYTLRLKSTQGRGGIMGDIPHTANNDPKFVNPLQKGLETQIVSAYARRGTTTLQTLVTRFLTCQPQWFSNKTTDGSCKQTKSTAVTNSGVTQRLGAQLLEDNLLNYILDDMGGNVQVGLGQNSSTIMKEMPIASAQALLRPLLQAPQAFVGAATYPFPIQAYVSAPFYQMVSQVFALVFVFAYVFTVSKVVVVLVQEKETRSRELMKILGMRESSIVLSWYVTYMLLFVVSSVLAGIAGTALFPNTSVGYMIIMFYLFSMSILSYGYLVSSIFSNSKTAATVGNSCFFIMYFLGYGVTSSLEPAKMALSFFSPVAFTFCIDTLSNVEGVSTGLTAANANTLYGNYRFQGGLGMLVVDTILYTLLGLYFEQVLPQEYGTPRKWYFIFQTSFWCGTRTGNAKVLDKAGNEDVEMTNTEPVGAELEAQEQDGRALKIRGIRKTFQTPLGITKVAVNGVNLSMYQDQITCLLGHNGAGKTTLMSILTGMISTTSGNAFFGGHSILTDMNKIRQSLGMCPQHDVLYADMTVEEHLYFYAKIKGYNGKELKDIVSSKIAEVGLTEKHRVYSASLSGGMKRKLSVAIALLGDSKLVFLDEPTSGMDPYSRRSTWELILNNRMNRVIVLTTHFMDEADILGDRIAIMAEGKVRCCGSSLFLKNKYGAGYTLTVAKTANSTATHESHLITFIKSFIPTATILSNVGSEISFQLALDSSPIFPTMFRKLESTETQEELQISSFGVSVTTLEEVFIKVAEIGDEDGQHTLGKTKETTSKSYSIQNIKQNAIKLFLQHLFALIQKRFRVARRDRKVMIFSTLLPIVMLYVGLSSLANSTLLLNDPKIRLEPAGQYPRQKDTPVPFVCARDDGGVCSNWGQKVSRGVPSAISVSDLPTPAANFTVFNQAYDRVLPMARLSYGPIPDTCLLASKKLYDRGFTDMIDGQFGGYVMYTSSSDQIMSYNMLVNTTAAHATVVFKAMVDEALVQIMNGNFPVTVHLYPFPITSSVKALFSSALSFIACLFISIAMTFFPASIVIFLVKEKQNEHNAKHQQLVSGVSLVAFWLANYVFDILLYMIPFAAALIMINAFQIQSLTGDDCTTCATETPAAVGVIFFLFGLAIIPFTYCISYIFKQHASSQNYTLMINMVLGLVLMIASFVMDLFESTKTANASLIYIWRLSPLFCLSNGLLRLSLHSLIGNFNSNAPVVSAFSNDVMGKDITYLIIMTFVYFACATGIDLALSFPKLKSIFQRDPQLPQQKYEEDQDVQNEATRVLNGNAANDMIVIKKLKKIYKGNKIAVRELSFGLHKGECFGYLGINGAGKTTTMKMLTGDILPTSGGATLGGFDILTQQLQVRRLVGYCPQFDALFELLTVREHLQLFAMIKGVLWNDVDTVVMEKMRQMNLMSFENKLAGTLSGGNKRKLSVAMAMIGSPPIIFLDEPSTGMDPVSRRFMWDVIADVSTTQKESTIVLTTHSMEECEALCTRVGIMVGGRLRCLGSVQHLKSRFGDGFMVHAKIDIPSSDTIRSYFESNVKQHVSNQSLQSEISRDEAKSLCSKLGAPDRASWLSPKHATGYALDAVWENNGLISLSLFSSWWVGETRYEALYVFLQKIFLKVSLLERQNEHCRFKLHENEQNALKLSYVFETMEGMKEELSINEYSVSQTTLEQIFNSFAKQQDEEKIVARGMEKN